MTTCSIEGCDGTTKSRGWCQAHYMRWWMKGNPGPAVVVRRQKGRVCSLNGCDRKHQGRGYCDTHLQRFIKYGEPGPAEIEPRRAGATCSIEECDNPHQGLGLCDKHLQRLRKTGDPLTPKFEHGYQWTGDNATYSAVHLRLRKAYGSPKLQRCVECDGPAADWAYDHLDPGEQHHPDGGRPYSTDLTHYRPMCKRCHKNFDVRHSKTRQ